MCGICGILNLKNKSQEDISILLQMLEMIRHRGPDSRGVYRDNDLLMGNVRLSIIDLLSGDQPICNEDESLWIVFNGEIYNYSELRQELEHKGHTFSTRTDTEVFLHLYEQKGLNCLQDLNGQFAVAIWNKHTNELLLARDRLGIRPLFYTRKKGKFLFSSEIKALLAYPGLQAEIDPLSLQQVFIYWSVQSPATIFKEIFEIPPAHYARISGQEIEIAPYWEPDFQEPRHSKIDADYLEEFEYILKDACRLRLRSDVPVGAYLSGGLDSSVTSRIVRDLVPGRLNTFSISFSNPDYDESSYQNLMRNFLDTSHETLFCTHKDIADSFPDIIWHTETPILRTAPAPMFLLSALVNRNNLKVVLTGEGADEILAGYDIFKEMKIRRFWAKNPESVFRPKLFRKIYADINSLNRVNTAYLAAFFRNGLEDTDSLDYSHHVRWNNTSRLQRFLTDQIASHKSINHFLSKNELPDKFSQWSTLAQAQYLEIKTFLSPYLLSSQSDRMSMAHSVEGRFPFLDYRLVEFCNNLPADVKLRGLTEKWLLKKYSRELVPQEIWQRNKRPYRAPICRSFFNNESPEYLQELLSEEKIDQFGFFSTDRVKNLLKKATSVRALSEMDDMAIAGILSTQLVEQLFCRSFQKRAETVWPNTKIIDRIKA
ncbi:MAG: asparagine synthase (glutamine-hydrolyzing) [Bacteroidales bacterium]|nr:asparagine synthase (glutamine-hydrolyzing) [Bacteroidales bacterium]